MITARFGGSLMSPCAPTCPMNRRGRVMKRSVTPLPLVGVHLNVLVQPARKKPVDGAGYLLRIERLSMLHELHALQSRVSMRLSRRIVLNGGDDFSLKIVSPHGRAMSARLRDRQQTPRRLTQGTMVIVSVALGGRSFRAPCYMCLIPVLTQSMSQRRLHDNQRRGVFPVAASRPPDGMRAMLRVWEHRSPTTRSFRWLRCRFCSWRFAAWCSEKRRRIQSAPALSRLLSAIPAQTRCGPSSTSRHHRGSGAIASVAAIATLFFGASGVFVELRDSLNLIWDVPGSAWHGWRGLVGPTAGFLRHGIGSRLLLLLSLVLSAVLGLSDGSLTLSFPLARPSAGKC